MLRAKLFDRLPVRLAGSLLLLSAAALIAVTEISRRAVERLLLQQAEVQAALSTASVADGLDAVIGSAERTARLVARELSDRTIDAAMAEKRARDVLLDNPNFHGCIVAMDAAPATGAAGRLAVEVRRASVAARFLVRDLAGAGEAPWPSPWYVELQEKAQPVWSEPYRDPESGRSVVRVAVPVFRNDNDSDARLIFGAVAIVLDLEWLRRLANLQEFADTSFTIVFSRSGRIILHPRANYAIAETMETLAEKTGAAELLTIRQNILSRRQGVLRYAETTPSRRVHVNYKPARTAGWGIIVGFDEAEFLKTQRAYRVIVFGLLGLLLALLTGIVIGVTHFALRPLGGLAVASGEIARGNLDCSVPLPKREDEIGRLARAFLAMRDALKAQHLERSWATQAMEHQLRYHQLIIDSMHELVFVLTKTLRISRVNPAALQATGCAQAELLQKPVSSVARLENKTALETADFLSQALRAEHELRSERVLIRAAEGRELPASLNLVPIRDGGRVVGAVVTLRTAGGSTPETPTR